MAKRNFSLMGEIQKKEAASASATDKTFPKDENKEVRATFIVSPKLLRKLKLIGALENRKHKEIVNAALDAYISQWEKAHPDIDLNKMTI